jgi:protein tyrosine phosphatase (PTP) superfamily phosphohydrolase (DUF442 family)
MFLFSPQQAKVSLYFAILLNFSGTLGTWCSNYLAAQQTTTATNQNSTSLPLGMQRKAVEGIENFIEVSDRVYSGGEPTTEGLQHLQKLGVTILLSVDGLSPDREAAEKLGLKYVHIPMGYDGIESQQLQDFVTLMAHHRGKLFVHCHHGKHRGPAAVAACLIISKEMTKEQAVQFMHGAGTSKDYKGLWKSIADLDSTSYQPLDLSRLLVRSNEKTMAQWMAELDRVWETIQEQQKLEAELNATQILLIAEAFRESARIASTAKEDQYGDKANTDRLVQWLKECEQEIAAIQELSRSQAHEKARDRMKSLARQCVDCHAKYRN